MPKYDGIKVLEMINEEKKKKYTNSCIVISGKMEYIQKLRKNQMIYSILQKSIDFEKIIEKINELVNQKQIENDEKELEEKIKEELLYLGYDISHKGTIYLIKTLKYISKLQEKEIENLKKDVYPYISKISNTSIHNVKCSIARATECMYYNCEHRRLQEYFKFQEARKPNIKTIIQTILLSNSSQVLATSVSRITDGMIYNIKNANSGKYLNVNSGTDANGTNVNQWTEDGSQEQKFRAVYFTDNNENAYKIFAMSSNKGANRVLDVLRTGGNASGTIVSGNNVDIWSTGDDDCQLFIIQLERNLNSGYGFSIRLKSNTSLALTAYGTGNGSGAGKTSTSKGNVYISTWTGAESQLWIFEKINATPAYPFKMTKGIGTQTYYIDSTASKYYNYIVTGTARWNSVINSTQASSNSSTAIDFYGVGVNYYDYIKELGNNWAAATTHHTPYNDDIVYGNYKGWNFAKIGINNDAFLVENNLKNEERYGVIAHEVGHSFGLKHSKDTKSIMYSSVSETEVYTPQTDDRNGLLYKY